VDHIKGVMLPEGAEVTLAFDAATGAVFGTSACNRYRGGFTLTGEGLTFGPAAGTMMACPDDLMAVERAFLATLESIQRFDLAEDGTLELISGDEALIRARR
jgi:heat shock protein HslJ